MGSIIMEPDDVAAYISGCDSHNTLKNITRICTFADRIHSTGVFSGVNPLEFSVPLLFLQLGLSAGTIILFSMLLKPLGQPLIVSQILGGVVLGSSGLGHLGRFREVIFPLRGFVVLDVISALGHVFFFFLIGVQTDISFVKKIDKKAFAIGSCSVILSMILSTIYSITLVNIVDIQTVKYLFAIGGTESFINFPMVASLVSELHLINSEFGRFALSTAMASNFFSICLALLGALLTPQDEGKYQTISTLYASLMLVAVIFFAIRPTIVWMIKKNPIGQPLKECFVVTLLLLVLVVAFCCQALGLHIYTGPLFLGVTIPSGPPIGSALVDRLDFITSWVFMPIFFVKIGLAVNIYAIKLINFLCMSFIVFVNALGKFLGALLISTYFKLSMRDAVSLGLILNCQGALELGVFKIMRKEKLINDEALVVMCVWVMVVVAIISPIIRHLLDPSRRFIVHKRRTVMHSRPEFDLCVLVCIHDQEDVPSAINLLDALNPTRRSHLVVYILHLVELLGRAHLELIYHKQMEVRTSRSCSSIPIVNAFKYFGESKREILAIYPFTAISPSTTMHDVVCSLALDKKTSLILVPFHQRFHSNGVLSLSQYKTKMVNHHILENAPCSVALVVERGILKTPKSIATNFHPFQIVMVFIGGPDDREAMFIGARMVGHPNINLTFIRLQESGNVPSSDVKERRLDNESVNEFRQSIADNNRVKYIEEVVKDGIGTISILRSLGGDFDLVIVGRQHNPCLALVQGLVLWNEQTELGAIGEVLASSDFIGNATILVVQQHRRVINEDEELNQEDIIPMDNTKKRMMQNSYPSKISYEF
ncbi:cation/H(+) antiporter 15-like [Cucurbita maxima]|uniref:Cation/H(+) antiporter 15-like n=1 Tax=Cucurbita maxima TaxID=3661 RepID=A0A6J1IZN7_CUCMA|nr:cation/H(+) antiporter 15-like [Cucurbita maxima]